MLSLASIFRINIHELAPAVSSNTWNTGLFLYPKTGATSLTLASYESLAEVEEDYTESSDPDLYLPVRNYFSVSPAPASCLIAAYAPSEDIEDVLDAVLEQNPGFYGVYLCDDTALTIKKIASWLESEKKGMLFYGVEGTPSEAVATTGLLHQLNALHAPRALGIYFGPDGAASAAAVMGKAMGLARARESASFALAFKHLGPYAATTPLTTSEANAIKAENGNIYVNRAGYSLLEMATAADGKRFTERYYQDQLLAALTDTVMRLFTSDEEDLPQSDETTAKFFNALSDVLNRFSARGILSTAVWNHDPMAGLRKGDILENGWYLYADSYDAQSEADRAARKAMPITIILHFAGSVESLVIELYL